MESSTSLSLSISYEPPAYVSVRNTYSFSSNIGSALGIRADYHQYRRPFPEGYVVSDNSGEFAGPSSRKLLRTSTPYTDDSRVVEDPLWDFEKVPYRCFRKDLSGPPTEKGIRGLDPENLPPGVISCQMTMHKPVDNSLSTGLDNPPESPDDDCISYCLDSTAEVEEATTIASRVSRRLRRCRKNSKKCLRRLCKRFRKNRSKVEVSKVVVSKVENAEAEEKVCDDSCSSPSCECRKVKDMLNQRIVLDLEDLSEESSLSDFSVEPVKAKVGSRRTRRRINLPLLCCLLSHCCVAK